MFHVQIINLYNPPFTVRGGSVWRKFENTGSNRQRHTTRDQTRGLIQTARTVWTMAYDLPIQMLKVGITM